MCRIYNAVGSARRSERRMQFYGIKIRFLSECSAVVGRMVRYIKAGGLNLLTQTISFMKYVELNTTFSGSRFN
jgi:hypothetical protein